MEEKDQITVFLPHQLRERAGGARSIKVAAGTVRQVIRAVDQAYPGMSFSICTEAGDLRPFVNVFVGPEDVRYLQGVETTVEPGSVVHIIHSVAGGNIDFDEI